MSIRIKKIPTDPGRVAVIAQYLQQHPDSAKNEVSEATGYVLHTVHMVFLKNRDLFTVSGEKPAVSHLGKKYGYGRPRQVYRLLPPGEELANNPWRK